MIVEDDDQQSTPNDTDMYALALALVREGRELFFSDQARHAARGGDISGGQRGEAGCVKITHITINGYFLTVLIYKDGHARRRVKTQLVQDSLDLAILRLAHYEGSVCH